MDKTTPQLDPKLKEAYDRVMGTVVTSPLKSPAQSQQANPPPVEHSEPMPVATPATPVTSTQPVLEHPTAATPATTVVEQAPIIQKGVPLKKKRKVSPLIVVLGVIVFLAVYAVVWVKYFNLKVPYLNP